MYFGQRFKQRDARLRSRDAPSLSSRPTVPTPTCHRSNYKMPAENSEFMVGQFFDELALWKVRSACLHAYQRASTET